MRVIVAMVLLVGVVHADSKSAAVHDRQAKAYFEAKQYSAAIDEFKKSYAQDKKPITLFKIASAYYAMADYAAAIDFYGQYQQADPNGPYVKQATEFTTIAKKALDDRKAEEDARVAAADQEKKKLAAAGRIMNAEAFAKEGAWASAGDEYRAATEIDGDPAHLLDAAEAYRKQPDHAKASEAYRAFLDKVPAGGKSDEARAKLAESVRALEAAEAEKKRIAEQQPPPKRDEPEAPKGPPPITRGWSSFGPRAMGGVTQPDTNPIHMGRSDGLVAKPSLELGAFGRYQLARAVAIRPEASVVYRSCAFDGQKDTMGGVETDALIVKRGGIQIAAPFYFSLSSGADGFRLGAGAFLAFMPFLSTKNKTGFTDGGSANLFDYGLLASAEYDFGLISLEFRFSKSFGELASDVEATNYTGLLGVTVGFEPPR